MKQLFFKKTTNGVCVTTERAGIIPMSDFYFDSESEALRDFLWRLRAGNRANNRDWKNFKG